MESDDILDQSQENQVDSIDIRDLLDVANAEVFDDDHDLISKTKNFEKVASFFDLIKSDTVAEPESVESDLTNSTSNTGDDNGVEKMLSIKRKQFRVINMKTKKQKIYLKIVKKLMKSPKKTLQQKIWM